MFTNQAIQTAQPTWDDLLRIPQGWLSEEVICTSCSSFLVFFPEPEGHESFIRCFSCMAKNVVTVSLRIIGWRR